MPEHKLTRREFVQATAGAGFIRQAPAIITGVKPIVISSANGNNSKDKDGLTCVASAFKMITSGADVLDAVVADLAA